MTLLVPRSFRKVLLLIATCAFEPVVADAQTGSAVPEIIHNSGHSSGLNSIVFSPKGDWLASGSSDGTVKLWDAASGRLLRTLSGHSQGVSSVAISPDGRQLASLSEDETAKIWNPATGQTLTTIKVLAGSQFDVVGKTIRYAPDGKSVLTGSMRNIRRWDANSGALIRSYPAATNFGTWQQFGLSPDGRTVAVAVTGAVGAALKDSGIGSQVRLLDLASGKIIRVLGTHDRKESVTAVSFSPDGGLVTSIGYDATVKLWDVATGQLRQTLTHTGKAAVAFSPDNALLATAGDQDGVKLWKVSDGVLVRTIAAAKYAGAVRFSQDGLSVAVGAGQSLKLVDLPGGDVRPWASNDARDWTGEIKVVAAPRHRWLASGPAGFTVWDEDNGQLADLYKSNPESFYFTTFFSRDGKETFLAGATTENSTISLWNVFENRSAGTFEWQPPAKGKGYLRPFLAPDGRWLASTFSTEKSGLKVWDIASGRLLHTLANVNADPAEMFSPDGRQIFASSFDGLDPKTSLSMHRLRIWDSASGQLIRTVTLPNKAHDGEASYMKAISPDGRSVVVQYEKETQNSRSYTTTAIVDAATGALVRYFPAENINNGPRAVSYSPDGRLILVGNAANSVNVWNADTGQLVRVLTGNPGTAGSFAFSAGGHRVHIGNENGTSAVWNIDTGALLTTTLQAADGEWVTITPEGFFTASEHGAGLLHVVQGFAATGVDQVYQSLYRPDLVREKLAGDPRGLVRQAATQLDLTKVLASGNPPEVRVTVPGRAVGSVTVDGTSAAAEAEITDRGGGVGRVEWRVNGVTVGVDTPAAGAPSPLRLTRSLALDLGDNAIEVTAYNGANLVASVAARLNVVAQAPAPAAAPQAAPSTPPVVAAKPRLFVLAAGINNYADERFKLEKAVWDAQEVARGFKEASGSLYQSVEVKLLTDADVTLGKLDAAFGELSAKAAATDVFVLYLAGHGKTVDGRYYFAPQDFSIAGELTEQSINAAVKAKAISQEQWQRWFAQIPARRSVMLFDTCESGTLADDETQQLQKGAANDRLVQATGRSILAASGGSQEALEGYHGHGLFTYEVLGAINDADSDRNGTIELNELAAYVYAEVSEVSQRIFKQRQVPQMKLTANYSLAKQMRILQDETTPVAAANPTYQVAQSAQLQVQPGLGATVVRSLSARTGVTVLESRNGWSLIASDGKPLGYVATRDLAPTQ